MTIGDGTNSTGQFNGSDHQPFVAALAALPMGGTIHVGQGTYAFGVPVDISQQGLQIESSSAVLLSSSDPDVGIFSVEGADVTLSGLTFRDDLPGSNSHALVRVQASGARVEACTFIAGESQGSPILLELSGPHERAWVVDNTFQPHTGWTAVLANGVTSLHLRGNDVGGDGAPALMRSGFWLVDAAWSELTGNVFHLLGTAADPIETAIRSENTITEGHHMTVSDNVFHDVTCARLIHFIGSQFNVVTGNSIGRISADPSLAVLDIDESATFAPTATLIQGNEIHNAGPAPMIRINGGAGFSVTGNHLNLVGGPALIIGDQVNTEAVHIASNAFSNGTDNSSYPAIRIHRGTRHTVIGNTFHDFASTGSVWVSGTLSPDDVRFEANIEQ